MSRRSPSGASRPRADPLIGREIARCRLESYVAGGASAVVYVGRHVGLGKPVAVKILRPDAAAIPSVVSSFRREAQAIARIDHENVLKVYDVVDDGDLHCMVMELLEGASVLDLITERGQLSQIDSLRILRQAAEGLAAVHARGIIHRDVKPQNLVVRPDGTVKLVDFGLAVEADTGSKRVGTPHYVSPETCASGHADAASDIYSLGVTFFHLLVGQPPFAGQSVQSVLRAHIQGEGMNLAERRPSLARPVVALFASLTRHGAGDRPTAADVVAAVDRVGGKRLRRKRPLRTLHRPSLGAPLLAGAACIAVAGGIAFLVLRDGPKANERTDRSGNSELTTGAAGRPASPEARGPLEALVPPAPPPVPAETEAERGLREQLEEEAQGLLDRAESWARENWRKREDTGEVVRRYDRISGIYGKTPASREAHRRAREIERGARHPHPDLAWSSPEKILEAHKLMEEKRASIHELVAHHRYRQAKAALPPLVSDPTGDIEALLRYEHVFLDALVAFPASLRGRLEASPNTPRDLDTPKGRGVIEGLTEEALSIRVDDDRIEVPWTDVPALSIARLAMPAYADADRAALVPFLAFCVAHGLNDAFWEATMSLDLGDGGFAEADLLRTMRERMTER